ncbi:MAG: nucleotidyltransferase substrate-binding protein [Mycoplasmataceae bacterium RC_NB112A]|nr:MAG: nucleotidyltransferase substrate binding protein [Mycoplasmataceae bacterium RC_NB112A]KLL01895.1 MAG: nucleotidyltransferase substrate-binding protein [Mycoplasmataceae bacterium RC_NB112A]
MRGVDYHTPKEVFRVAALDGLISDAEAWFDYVDKRNITTHEYEQNILKAVYPILPKFLKDLDLLIKNLKKL